jgi:signal transduction histidine kinase
MNACGAPLDMVPNASRPRGRVIHAAAIAAGYFAASVLWIVYSDHLGQSLFGTAEGLTRFQTWKGIGFVAVSTLLLYAAAWTGWRQPQGDEEAARLPRSRGRSVGQLLAMLVLATALPLAGLLVWHVQRETQVQRDSAERLVRALARSTAEETALFLHMRMRMAAALVQRADVRDMARHECDPLVQNLPELDSAVMEVSTFDLQGHRVCGGKPRTPTRTPQWREQLRASGAFVDDLRQDGGTGAWTFTMVQPVLDDAGRLQGALEIVLSAAVLVPVTAGPVPAGGAIAVFDRNNAMVARFPSLPGATGVRFAGAGTHLRAGDGRSYTTTGVDGMRRLYVAQSVDGTGWIASVGVPLDELYAPARAAFARSMVAGLLILAFCSLLVVGLARRLTAPLRALQRTAAQAATGDFTRRAPEGGPAELADLGAGMNRMLEQLPRLQRELDESETRSRLQVEKLSRNLPEMIFVLESVPGQGRRMLFASEAIRTILELEPHDVAEDATAALDRIHWLDRERVEQGMAAALGELSHFTAEFRVQLPRAGVRHVLARAQPERTPDGRTVWYGALSDVTEFHASRQALALLNENLEQRIAERTAELAKANEALEAFSYSVAHDLRAPLASIGGFADVVADALRKGDLERARTLAGRIVVNAGRMNTMIEALLSLARAGRGPLVELPVDMRRLVGEVLEDLPRAPHARVDVAQLPRVLADQATLRQAWHNLLSNAIKYSAGQPQPAIGVGWRRAADGDAVFFVEDNGVGFDPEYAGRLFTPFTRLHKECEFEGTGVGLSLVRRIVERHGGRAWAEVRPGGGARFYFSLPAGRLLEEEPDAA